MLKQLHIQHLILIENADITFIEGLNVMTGETGAGKSAIMEALTLILGDRADSGVIRHGCEKAIVEASFDIQQLPHVLQLLEKAGIDHDKEDDLLIRREISANGKSRAFLNNQMAQLTVLREIGKHLIKFVGQHANHQLFQLDYHRHTVDQYGGLLKLTKEFSLAWEEENKLRKELDDLIHNASQRLREIEVCQMELEELESAHIKPNEEEELFAEYSRMSHADEISRYLNDILNAINGEKQAALAPLNRQKNTFEKLLRLDPTLQETSALFQQAIVELQEVAYTIQQAAAKVEHDPAKMEEINVRLTLINRLKKKYGPSIEELTAYQEKTAKRLSELEHSDDRIDELRTALQKAEEKANELAESLTTKRQQAAQKLSQAIITQLRSLNMPQATFEVRVTPQPRQSNGDDAVEFFLAPNVGERPIPVRECASGGEISRIVLSLHVLLAGKEQIPTLLFDEVDANIGGETAAAVGEKLEKIGSAHQVICVTHFPQVAIKAQHHLQICKKETEGRTMTRIQVLDSAGRQTELTRMLGGKEIAGTNPAKTG